MTKRQGFTLIELLLYAGLVAIVTSAIGSLLVLSVQARVKQQVVEQVENAGTLALTDMTNVIRTGDTITVGTDGGGIATLTVGTFDGATNPTVYEVSSSKLTKKEGSASALDLTPASVRITGLSYTVNSASAETQKVVDIAFTVSTAVSTNLGEFYYTQPFQGSAVMRTP